jgi:hypothetical protein
MDRVLGCLAKTEGLEGTHKSRSSPVPSSSQKTAMASPEEAARLDRADCGQSEAFE